MGKRVLVLAGSPRRHGNTDRLADEFIRSAKEAGHETEKIYLKDKKSERMPWMRRLSAKWRLLRAEG